MTWIVVYDVHEDALRDRVAKVCEGFGIRVQESVFECRLDQHGVDRLADRLRHLLDRPGRANVRFYRVCTTCLRSSFALADPPDDSPTCIIV